jgi:hypothetical protein
MAFPPLIVAAMPPLAARRRLAQWRCYQFFNVGKSLPNVPSWRFA